MLEILRNLRCLAVPTEVGPAVPIPGTSMCTVAGWEYAARWDIPSTFFETLSVEECAQLCEDRPACTGSTYISSTFAELNCWLKTWDETAVPPPCISESQMDVQALFNAESEECSGFTFRNTPLTCKEEALVRRRQLALDPSPDSATVNNFIRYPGRDYNPAPLTAGSIPVHPLYMSSCMTSCTCHCF